MNKLLGEHGHIGLRLWLTTSAKVRDLFRTPNVEYVLRRAIDNGTGGLVKINGSLHSKFAIDYIFSSLFLPS